MDGSQLFIVRIWPQRASFRASARLVDQEETRVFGEPAELLQFLRSAGTALSSSPPPPSDEGTT